jgi:hypothetical protein
MGIAGVALLFPGVTLAEQSSNTTFFSPPPGTASISVRMSKVAQSLDGIEVRAIVVAKCGPFEYLNSVNSTFTVLQVDQNVVRSATGFITPSVVCDNAVHQYQGVATVNSGSAPLAPGSAVIQANINACGTNNNYQYQCAQGFASHGVTLR